MYKVKPMQEYIINLEQGVKYVCYKDNYARGTAICKRFMLYVMDRVL